MQKKSNVGNKVNNVPTPILNGLNPQTTEAAVFIGNKQSSNVNAVF